VLLPRLEQGLRGAVGAASVEVVGGERIVRGQKSGRLRRGGGLHGEGGGAGAGGGGRGRLRGDGSGDDCGSRIGRWGWTQLDGWDTGGGTVVPGLHYRLKD
jgi:hypothetical protein